METSIQLKTDHELFITTAMEEYHAMVGTTLNSLKGIAISPGKTKRSEKETFGSGHGVRKETYLGTLPGKRELRVAEVRDSFDLQPFEKVLNE